jgi:hypothetical protein
LCADGDVSLFLMSLISLLQQASRDQVLFLPRVEAHEAGGVIGLLSFAVGVAAAQGSFPGHELVAWAALAGVLAGMVLHWRWKKAHAGWRIDFGRRMVEPVGLRGRPEPIEGEGWSIQVAPGDKRTCVAIDLRHVERGRVARLLDMPARGKSDTFNLDQLADRLALRLQIPRTGQRL